MLVRICNPHLITFAYSLKTIQLCGLHILALNGADYKSAPATAKNEV